ncbi:amidohydrolase family protein [Streptomyces inhibens]|uniref:amidohydrolase family protein n=1 Tax=Streptomyces inhibens TaxID=2293571 RepID=UPI001EE6AAEE|nr:amidohydrolase family protein [Streptomyces inhibens]UKY54522.1 amidohydrolase family protein [Streptomyces inhibens]
MPPPADDSTSRFALRGRLVTLDPDDTVIEDGILYGSGRLIEALRPAAAEAPPGFEQIVPVETGGTVYPGLIELHNHLPYGVLPLWQVPKKYGNRSQWGGSRNPAYHGLVTGPMTVLGQDPQLMPAVVRYVEAKALVNGTTTSQGIALFSNTGARRMYRGVIRNIEQTDDADLPEASSRIADVEATDAEQFVGRLNKSRRLLLHLAEGTDDDARAHFQALEFQPGKWAITENLVGIHCTALTASDFEILARHGGSMVWSPLSNLLLYGRTADIAAAKKAHVLMGLGSDWSVSGSKGLLGELKAARLASAAAGDVFTDQELVAMATRDAARILRWDQALGSLRPGLRADVLVVDGIVGDPYTTLIDTRDTGVQLVMIDGVARYGTRKLLQLLAPGAPLEEPVSGAPADRALNLRDPSADPVVAGLTLAEATRRLSTALADLPLLASRADRAPLAEAPLMEAPLMEVPDTEVPDTEVPGAEVPGAEAPDTEVRWQLALDEVLPTGAELRPRLPLLTAAGTPQPTGPDIGPAPTPLAEAVQAPVTLDGLTASADIAFLTALAHEANLPADYGAELSRLLS